MGCCLSKNNVNDYEFPNPLNILYIEDCESYLNLMKYIFDNRVDQNINVVWKANVDEGLEYLNNNNVDLIFLDRNLRTEKIQDGDNLIKIIKDQKIFDLRRVIIISGVENKDDIIYFNKLGITYFVKPIKVEEFLKTIKEIIKS